MYAVFRSGGKQYRAAEGNRLKLEKIDADEGASVEFDQVLLVGEGADVKVGSPYLSGSVVTAKIIAQGKTKKVSVVKFKRRQNYLRQGSHRQFFTEVEITSIGAGKAPAKKAADKPAAEAVAKEEPKKEAPKKAAPKKAATKKTATKKTATKKATAKKVAAKKDSE